MPFLYVTTQATCTSSVPTNNLPSSHSPTLQSNLSRSVQSELVQVTYACSASSGSLKWAISNWSASVTYIRCGRDVAVVGTLHYTLLHAAAIKFTQTQLFTAPRGSRCCHRPEAYCWSILFPCAGLAARPRARSVRLICAWSAAPQWWGVASMEPVISVRRNMRPAATSRSALSRPSCMTPSSKGRQ